MKINLNLLVYSVVHALVDAACAAVVFFLWKTNAVSQNSFIILVILYNFLAFGLQAPLGMIVDKWRIPVKFAAFGCIVVAVSAFAARISPIMAIYLAGIGNALFHVGGGVVALNLEPRRASMPGVFVAPGALGLLAGTLISKDLTFIAWPFVILLLISALVISTIKKINIDYSYGNRKPVNYLEMIILLILFSVVIRSLVGLAIVFSWKQNPNLLIILTMLVFLGKALGGILADRFGWMRVAMISLLVSAPLLSFGSLHPIYGLAGIFLFNISIPITLVAISNMLPGRAGLAFGLTTFALLIGAILTFTKYKEFFSGSLAIFMVVIISAGVLYKGLKMYFLTEKANA
jgi:MFS transporter, FSR family, fosmidomycin resistance protein